jgi:hypothetical protein
MNDWRELALDVYRLASEGRSEWQKLRRDDLDYWIEELGEALLDLKQATIEDDEARGLHHMDENGRDSAAGGRAHDAFGER